MRENIPQNFSYRHSYPERINETLSIYHVSLLDKEFLLSSMSTVVENKLVGKGLKIVAILRLTLTMAVKLVRTTSLEEIVASPKSDLQKSPTKGTPAYPYTFQRYMTCALTFSLLVLTFVQVNEVCCCILTYVCTKGLL